MEVPAKRAKFLLSRHGVIIPIVDSVLPLWKLSFPGNWGKMVFLHVPFRVQEPVSRQAQITEDLTLLHRPVSITGGASFVYDGDGSRLKKTEGGVTTTYMLRFRRLCGPWPEIDQCQQSQEEQDSLDPVVARRYAENRVSLAGKEHPLDHAQ